MRRTGTILAIILAVGTMAGLSGTEAFAAPSASPIGGTWGPTVPVQDPPNPDPGISPFTITAISCTGPGDCTAGGGYQLSANWTADTDSVFVVSEVNGKWGDSEPVPGTVALNTGLGAGITGVSCSSPGNCVAVGYYAYGYEKSGKSKTGTAGFVASQVNGTWQTARPVPALSSAVHYATMTGVSCASATTAAERKAGLNCVAVGYSQLPYSSVGFVLAEVNGKWGTARTVPGLSTAAPGSAVTSVSCPFRGTCGIGGYYADKSRHEQAFVADEVKGTWGKVQEVPGTATLNAGGNASVASVSCTAVGGCTAAGTYKPKKGSEQLFVASETAGKWQKAIQLPGSSTLIKANGSVISAVSCASTASCAVGGTLQTAAATTRGFVASETSGKWGAPDVMPGGTSSSIYALSCPAPGYCAAGGQRITGIGSGNVIVLDEAAGRWGKVVDLYNGAFGNSGTLSLYAVSCSAPRDCGAGGDESGFEAVPYGWVANETPVK
jgi:hypothetical protein